MNVLFRCDASSEIGLGHIVRCFALAEELHTSHNCKIIFVSRESDVQIDDIVKPFKVVSLDTKIFPEKYESHFLQIVNEHSINVVVFDVRDGLNSGVVENLKQEGITTVTIDDPEDKRLLVDMVFCPSVPQVRKTNWDGFSGRLYTGFEYVLLRKEFSGKYPRQKNKIPNVLVSMGGSDPAGLTFNAVKALEILDEEFQPTIVVGAGFARAMELEEVIKKSRHSYVLKRNVINMADLMRKSDMAIASFGMTVYELIAAGVPAVCFCLTQDHAMSASILSENNIGINLGLHTNVTAGVIAESLKKLLKNETYYNEMVNNLIKIECGTGAKQISSIITKKVTYGK